jgi:hypothetical protein
MKKIHHEDTKITKTAKKVQGQENENFDLLFFVSFVPSW